jgi:hypothetical protein
MFDAMADRKDDGLLEAAEVIQEQKIKFKIDAIWEEFHVDLLILDAARERRDVDACDKRIFMLAGWLDELKKLS